MESLPHNSYLKVDGLGTCKHLCPIQAMTTLLVPTAAASMDEGKGEALQPRQEMECPHMQLRGRQERKEDEGAVGRESGVGLEPPAAEIDHRDPGHQEWLEMSPNLRIM